MWLGVHDNKRTLRSGVVVVDDLHNLELPAVSYASTILSQKLFIKAVNLRFSQIRDGGKVRGSKFNASVNLLSSVFRLFDVFVIIIQHNCDNATKKISTCFHFLKLVTLKFTRPVVAFV